MNTKTLLAGTILTVLFAGTSAMAEDAGFDSYENFNAAATETVVAQKVSYEAPQATFVGVNR